MCCGCVGIAVVCVRNLIVFVFRMAGNRELAGHTSRGFIYMFILMRHNVRMSHETGWRRFLGWREIENWRDMLQEDRYININPLEVCPIDKTIQHNMCENDHSH